MLLCKLTDLFVHLAINMSIILMSIPTGKRNIAVNYVIHLGTWYI